MIVLRAATLLGLALWAFPADAHHRQTPPVVPVLAPPDAFLPRVAAFHGRLVLALGSPGSRQIFRRERDNVTLTPLTTSGDNADPVASATGKVVAWDSDADLLGDGDTGRQVYVQTGTTLAQPAHDATGTSTNPAMDARGRVLALQSRGDLAGTGALGTSQIYLRGLDGSLTQVSRGAGDSGNPAFDRFGKTLVFDSTSDPSTGADTGVSQIWIAGAGVAPVAVTNGLGSSRRPAISPRGRFVAFESTADLAGAGTDTGVPQVFVYDRLSGNQARVTNEPGGCTEPTVDEVPGDTRVVFVCGGVGLLHRLRADQRFRLPVDGGTTAQAVAELGNFFVAVSTTADVLHDGWPAGFRIYQLNLYKLAAVPVAGSATWSPDPAFRP